MILKPAFLKKKCMNCIQRRQFIQWGIQSIASVATVSPMLTLLSSCNSEDLTIATNPGSTIPTSSNGVYSFHFTDYPQLNQTGGSLHAKIQATSRIADVYITRVSQTIAETVSTTCTHLGCQINAYNSSTRQYNCPCHGSIFNSDGTVAQGPATSSLPTYPTQITPDAIEVVID